MKRTAFVPLIMSMVLVTSCAMRQEYDSFTGRVVAYGSGEPIPEAMVILHYYKSIPGRWGGGSPPYDTVFTDQDGYFFADGREHSPSDLTVYTRDSNYYDMRISSASGKIGITTSFLENPVIELKPFGWLQLEVDWSAFKGKFDYVRVQGCTQCSFTFHSDTILSAARVLGNHVNGISMFGYKDAALVDRFQNDSIYCPGFDTTTHVITY
jgi:hypothetical protein